MTTHPKPGSIFLVVDDDDRLRERLARALVDRGFITVTADRSGAAIDKMTEPMPTHAIVDLRMPGESGIQLIPVLLARSPTLKIVMLTGYGSVATAVEAVKLGAVNFLGKPADADMILAAFGSDKTGTGGAPDYEPPSLARAEWELINRVLEDCDGNITLAARKLGLHRRTLQRKLQKYPPRR